jgi:hypothetical protein
MDRRAFLRNGIILSATTMTLSACTSTPTDVALTSSTPTTGPTTRPGPSPNSTPGSAGSAVLLAYFSRPGENYYYGDRIDLQIGNTQVVADMMASATTATSEPSRGMFRRNRTTPAPRLRTPCPMSPGTTPFCWVLRCGMCRRR